MSWPKSSRVHHRKLRRDGVVVEVMKSGTYRVAFGSLVVECSPDDLTGPKGSADDDDELEATKNTKKSRAKSAGGGIPSVDLHGMRVDEALALVQARVNDALMAGASGFQIIHGHGTGKLKAAVHKYLKSLSVVKRFQVDPKRAGSTVAYF